MATKKLASKKAIRNTKVAKNEVRDTARDLLLASIGAVSISRKQGAEFVGQLLDQGQGFRVRAAKLAEGKVADVREQVIGAFGKVQQRAAANLSQVETAVGGQVTRVLGRLGVPSKADVKELSRRVTELNKQVKALQASRKAAEPKAA